MTALAELIAGFTLQGSSDPYLQIDVAGITDDSRCVGPGDLFVAVSGAASDGHAFASHAVEQGAVAVLAEHELPALSVPVITVSELKLLRSELASRLHQHPSRDLCCVGVTGTNGKTSIACFIAELATLLGHPSGYMGTIGWGELGELRPSGLTTESAIVVQQRLARFRDQGKHWAVLEASSHALDQHRVDGVTFDYAVFSNLSRDHLDYHDDFEGYGRAKARLFRFPELKAAVINIDDEFGRGLAEELSGSVDIRNRQVDVITCGEREGADVSWHDLEFHPDGVRGAFRTPWGATEFELPLYGTFSVANAAAALAVLCHAGSSLAAVVGALTRLSSVPGRMEFFPGQPTLVVDYAHTPDALEKMLRALRPHASGQLVCLCGCGGDRDRGKRPLMAAAACANSDQVWLTSDNPRSEDPDAIIEEMMAGVPAGAHVSIEPDRLTAIRSAFSAAAAEDLLVIAGKGHEDYQEVGGLRLPFSDRAIAANLTADVENRPEGV